MKFLLLVLLAIGLACGQATEPVPGGPGPDPEPEPEPTACEFVRSVPRSRLLGDRLRNVQPRIVGGTEARPGEFSFAAAISVRLSNGSLFQFCGGSLIGPDWIKSAAHCEIGPGDIAVLGRHDLRGSDGVEHEIAYVLTHPNYDPQTSDNDIALVKLRRASILEPVELIDEAETSAQPGDTSTVIGWGRLSEGGPTSHTLQKVDVPIWENASCNEVYGGITENMVCAGRQAGGVDSCQGDSGGPLLVNVAGKWRDMGTTSFGSGCAQPGIPGVYSRVSKFRSALEVCMENPPS